MKKRYSFDPILSHDLIGSFSSEQFRNRSLSSLAGFRQTRAAGPLSLRKNRLAAPGGSLTRASPRRRRGGGAP